MSSPSRRRRWAGWALGIYALGAAVLLLSPVGPGRILGAVVGWIREDLGWSGFHQGWLEAPANVVLFVPLGFLLVILFRSARIGVMVAVMLSVSAELVQILLPDRLPSLRDVIANSAGAAIGALLAWLFTRHRRDAHDQRDSPG